MIPVKVPMGTSFFALKYFTKVEGNCIEEGMYFCIIITLILWIIDALFMLPPSPIQMTLSDYFQEIEFT